MAARHKARKRALDVLFEAEQRGIDVMGLLAERSLDADRPMPAYTVQVVNGVTEHRARLDELLTTYSQGWSVERMPAVDRSLLRIGLWELLHNDEVSDEVAISEAVELASELSTDDSPRFVNGLLARVAALRHTLA